MDESLKIGESEKCKHCVYFESPDYGCAKECTFPWMGDWTDEEAALMECQNEEAEDGECK